MKILECVPSFELCLKLREEGFPQNTTFFISSDGKVATKDVSELYRVWDDYFDEDHECGAEYVTFTEEFTEEHIDFVAAPLLEDLVDYFQKHFYRVRFSCEGIWEVEYTHPAGNKENLYNSKLLTALSYAWCNAFGRNKDKLPKAVKEGIVEILGEKITVANLSNGQRVMDADQFKFLVEKIFGVSPTSDEILSMAVKIFDKYSEENDGMV